MATIPFEVLDLSSAAGGRYGVFQGRIRGNVTGGIQLTADLCHGLQLGVDGRIAALVEGHADALFIGAQLRGEAAAEAGAKVLVRLEPNLFETLGLSIEAGAYARAHAAGSVAIYLTPEYLARFANEHFDDFTSDLFLIFLEEVYAEVGVWGKAAFSAMVDGHVDVVIDLRELDAGFELSAGGDYGVAGGVGWDFYCNAGFRDLRRAVFRSSLRIGQEIRAHIHSQQAGVDAAAGLALDFAFPLVALIAFDLGNASHQKQSLLSADEVSRILLDDFVENLQRFAFDRLLEGAIGRLSGAFSDLYYRVVGIDLDDDDRTRLRTEIEGLIEILKKGRVNQTDLGQIVERSLEIVDILDGGAFDSLKRPLALVWTAGVLGLQIRSELDEFYADAEVDSSLFNALGTGATTPVLPSPPSFVLEEVRSVTGADVLALDVSSAVDYLIAIGAEDLILEHAPAFAELRSLLESTFELSEGELVEDLLRLWKGEGALSELNSYQGFRSFVKYELIQGYLFDRLFVDVDDAAANPTLSDYLREVVEPSVRIVSEFLFGHLDSLLVQDVVNPIPPTARERITEGITTGCGVIVFNVIGRNVVFFDKLVSDFVLQEMHEQFGALSTAVESSDHPFVQMCAQVAHQSLPGAPDLEVHAEAFRVLVYDLVTALRKLTGPTIYSYERRERIYELKRDLLLGVGGSAGFGTVSEITAAIDEMIDCSLPGLQLAKLEKLTGVLFEIGVESLEIIGEDVLPSIGDFFLKVTLHEFTELRSALLSYIQKFYQEFEAARRAFDEATDDFRAWVTERLDELETRLSGLLAGIQAHLKSDWESTLRTRLHAAGVAAIRARGLLPAEEVQALERFEQTEWPPIDAAIAVTAPLVRSQFVVVAIFLDGFVDEGSDAIEAFMAFVESVEDLVLENMENLAVSATTCAEVAVETLFPQWLLAQIEDYLREREEQKALKRVEYDRAELLAVLAGRKQAARDRYEEVGHRADLEIEVLSPLPDLGHVYAASVEVAIELRHFTRRMLIGNGRRLQVMLNGEPVPLRATDLEHQRARDAFLFRKTFVPGVFVGGLNVLELSYVFGETSAEVVRETARFIVDAGTYYPVQHFEVGFEANPPGRDVENEFVEIGWRGPMDLDLEGWIVRDRANHRYALPPLVLAPGEHVRIYTGGRAIDDVTDGGASEKRVHMGRGQGVWNNDGDTLYLINDEAVVAFAASYAGIR